MGFKRLLSKIGVGAATVDTKLEKSEFEPGEEVRGVVEIKGGDQEQEVEGIHVRVSTRYDSTLGSSKAVGTVGKFPVAAGTTAEPGSHKEVPFSFRLPHDTPLSVGGSEVWLRTELNIESAFDPTDDDSITVRPTPAGRAVLDALERLGFEQRNVKTEELPDRIRRRLHYGQEFEFAARRGEFGDRLDELELVMFPSEGSVDVLMQVDRRGFGGESYAQLTVSESEASQNPDRVAEALAEAIRQHI